MGPFSSALLQLLEMVVSAGGIVRVSLGERPVWESECAVLQGGSDCAIHWVNECRGGREPQSGALMRLLGVLEMVGSWHFSAQHVPGVINTLAVGISRWPSISAQCKIVALRPDIP